MKENLKKFPEKEEKKSNNYNAGDPANYKQSLNDIRIDHLASKALEKGLVIVAGHSGVGKSMWVYWMMYQLAKADNKHGKARQTTILGYQCEPALIYYYSLETAAREFFKRTKDIGDGKNRPSNLTICDRCARTMSFTNLLDELKQLGTEYVLSGRKENLVFVIDPVNQLDWDGLALSDGDIAKKLTDLRKLTNNPDYGCPTIILVAHFRKESSKDKDENGNDLGSLYGSNTFQSIPNQEIHIYWISEHQRRIYYKKSRKTSLDKKTFYVSVNKDCSFSLLDNADIRDVSDLIVRTQLCKIIFSIRQLYKNDVTNEIKQAEEEKRLPVIPEYYSTEPMSAQELLFDCFKIYNLLPNNFYKFIKMYRPILRYSGIDYEVIRGQHNTENKFIFTYTPNEAKDDGLDDLDQIIEMVDDSISEEQFPIEVEKNLSDEKLTELLLFPTSEELKQLEESFTASNELDNMILVGLENFIENKIDKPEIDGSNAILALPPPISSQEKEFLKEISEKDDEEWQHILQPVGKFPDDDNNVGTNDNKDNSDRNNSNNMKLELLPDEIECVDNNGNTYWIDVPFYEFLDYGEKLIWDILNNVRYNLIVFASNPNLWIQTVKEFAMLNRTLKDKWQEGYNLRHDDMDVAGDIWNDIEQQYVTQYKHIRHMYKELLSEIPANIAVDLIDYNLLYPYNQFSERMGFILK